MNTEIENAKNKLLESYPPGTKILFIKPRIKPVGLEEFFIKAKNNIFQNYSIDVSKVTKTRTVVRLREILIVYIIKTYGDVNLNLLSDLFNTSPQNINHVLNRYDNQLKFEKDWVLFFNNIKEQLDGL